MAKKYTYKKESWIDRLDVIHNCYLIVLSLQHLNPHSRPRVVVQSKTGCWFSLFNSFTSLSWIWYLKRTVKKEGKFNNPIKLGKKKKEKHACDGIIQNFHILELFSWPRFLWRAFLKYSFPDSSCILYRWGAQIFIFGKCFELWQKRKIARTSGHIDVVITLSKD